MQLTQQFEVSNPNDGVVVVTPDPEKQKTYLRFEGKGDVDGADTLWVSREQLQSSEMVKAVQRGVLEVEVDDLDPLKSMLRVRKRPSAEAKPLTATRVLFTEEEYKPYSVDIPVVIEPLMKVYG